MAHRALVALALTSLLTACPGGDKTAKKQPPKPAADKPAPPTTRAAKKASSAPVVRPVDPLLGGERGLDHIGVVVDDLAAARAAYTKLGFSNPQPGRLPNGIKNVNFYFGDSTYLELLTTYDDKKAAGVASFARKHKRGAMFFVLVARSFQRTAAFLRRAGVPVGRPFPGRIKSPGFSGNRTMWHTYFFADPKPLPQDPFFFITYRPSLRAYLLRKLRDPKIRAKSFTHANGAVGLLATYLVTTNLAKTSATYRKIGLAKQRPASLTSFEARAQRVVAGAGELVLLQPMKEGKGRTAAFVKRRGDGAIIGLTIAVEDLAKAKAIVDEALGRKTKVETGLFGKSIWIPPKDAFGTWLELTQPASPPRP